jgi:PH domain associated with Beige/BEACH
MESVVARFNQIEVVTVRTITVGKLLLTSHGLYFHQTGDNINVMTKEIDHDSEEDKLVRKSLRWRLSRLREAHGRRFMLRAQAIELFFADGTELFLNFEGGARERDRFYAKLRNSCKVSLIDPASPSILHWVSLLTVLL